MKKAAKHAKHTVKGKIKLVREIPIERLPRDFTRDTYGFRKKPPVLPWWARFTENRQPSRL